MSIYLQGSGRGESVNEDTRTDSGGDEARVGMTEVNERVVGKGSVEILVQ